MVDRKITQYKLGLILARDQLRMKCREKVLTRHLNLHFSAAKGLMAASYYGGEAMRLRLSFHNHQN
jgi:hypothetical protein